MNVSESKSNVVISYQYLDCKQISKHCDICKKFRFNVYAIHCSIQDSKNLIERLILKPGSIAAYQSQDINSLIIDTIIDFLYFSLKN